MNITKRGAYAMRTLIRLGRDHQQGLETVSVSSLATREKLPFKFLEVILFELRHAGFVETVRGNLGGARLAKPMNSILIGDVIRLIEGDIAPTNCTSELNDAKCSCPHKNSCGVRMLMIDVHQAILSILDCYSLQQLVDVLEAKQKIQNPTQSIRQSKSKLSRKRHADPADGFLAALMHTEPCSNNLSVS